MAGAVMRGQRSDGAGKHSFYPASKKSLKAASREARRAAQQEEKALQACAESLNQKIDLLSETRDLNFSELQEQNISLSYRCSLAPDELSFCIGLQRDHVAGLALQSAEGWSEAARTAALRDQTSRFLMICSTDISSDEWILVDPEATGDGEDECTRAMDCHVGFVQIEFCTALGALAMKVLQFHLEPSARGKGLGAAILGVLERLASANGVGVVLVCTAEASDRAVDFFSKKLGFNSHGGVDAKALPPNTLFKRLEAL